MYRLLYITFLISLSTCFIRSMEEENRDRNSESYYNFLLHHYTNIEHNLMDTINGPWQLCDRFASNAYYGLYYTIMPSAKEYRNNSDAYATNGGILRYLVGGLLITASGYKTYQLYKKIKRKQASKTYVLWHGSIIVYATAIGLRMLTYSLSPAKSLISRNLDDID